MKTTILFISFLLLSMAYISGYAQSTHPTRLGVKAGLNISSLNSSDDASSELISGFNLGVFNKIPITNYVAVQPELYVTTKGATVNYNSQFVNGAARFNLTYLEIPVLCVVNITNYFNVHIGPYVGYLISGKVKNESQNAIFDFEENIDAHDFNRIDTGIALGAGLDVGAVSIGARYNAGFTKVGKEQTTLGTTYRVPNATNGVLNFYISLSLN